MQDAAGKLPEPVPGGGVPLVVIYDRPRSVGKSDVRQVRRRHESGVPGPDDPDVKALGHRTSSTMEMIRPARTRRAVIS